MNTVNLGLPAIGSTRIPHLHLFSDVILLCNIGTHVLIIHCTFPFRSALGHCAAKNTPFGVSCLYSVMSYTLNDDLACSMHHWTVHSDEVWRRFFESCVGSARSNYARANINQTALSSLFFATCLPCLGKAINQVWCHFTTANTKLWKINTKHQQILCVREAVEWLWNRKSTFPCLFVVVESKVAFVRSLDDMKLFLELVCSFVVWDTCVDGVVVTSHFLGLLFLCLCDLWRHSRLLKWNSGHPGKLSFVALSGKVAFFPTISMMSLRTDLFSLIVALWVFTSWTMNRVLFARAFAFLRINAM